jgi:dTDP-4-dehydrorhamnose 3,5-epimerase
MPQITPTSLPDVVEITPERFSDERGFFSEVYNEAALKQAGIDCEFVQDNHSFSASNRVLRGLHFQSPPFAQAKLVRVTRGSVMDVAVDIRPRSPTFRQWARVEVSAKKWNQVYIPAGFAHGFVTLEPDTEVLYKVSAAYSVKHEHAIRYDDLALGIDWGVDLSKVILSDRDREAPLFSEIESGF